MKKRLLAGLLALCMLFSLAACGSQAGANATSMRLTRTQGQVQVFDGAGAEVAPRESLGLYSGYGVDTGEESFAWINLDDVKLTKMDEDSEIEITKSGKSLEINVISGSLFFHVTEPLEDDETLNIRTSSMVVGIRGTCGWVTEDTACLLVGKVEVTAGERSAAVTAGEMAVVTGDGTVEVLPLSNEDIPAYVRDEISEDLDLNVPNKPEGGGQTGGATTEGTDGNISWSLVDGVLTISGTGDMKNYTYTLYAPWHRETFHSVIIKPGVTSIGDYAFYGCNDLTGVTLPDSVTSIGGSAFRSCRSLTSVDIPDSVTSIREHAFSDCRGLTDVTIPGSVISIEDSAFADCGGLTNVTILDGVTSIGKNAFGSCGLTGVAIPDSVTSIGDSAFAGCGSLTSVDIPNGVTAIGKETFYGCVNMTSVSIPDSVTAIGTSAFHYCPSLTSVVIPSSVISIGDFAFASCYKLASVTIPESVTSIGKDAFGSCGSLTDVYYTGTEEQWTSIDINDLSNDELLAATIHYNSPN